MISGGTVCESERTSALSRRECAMSHGESVDTGRGEVECTLTRKSDASNARQVQPTLHPSTHLFSLPNGTVGADTDRAQLHADALVAVSFEFDAITLKVQGNAYCSHETSVGLHRNVLLRAVFISMYSLTKRKIFTYNSVH